MSTFTKINITKPLIFMILKNNTVSFNIPTTSDYSGKAVRFSLKLVKQDTSPVLLMKHNLADGGDDAQLVITPNNVQVNIISTDTAPLPIPDSKKMQRFYWELKDITSEDTIVEGYIILMKTLITDDTVLPVFSSSSRIVFSMQSNVFTLEKNTSSNTVSCEYNGDGDGLFTITSEHPLFTNNIKIMLSIIAKDTDDDIYLFKEILVDVNTYKIGIVPFAGGDLINHDFRVEIYEVTA
jgi:hypothetical protein